MRLDFAAKIFLFQFLIKKYACIHFRELNGLLKTNTDSKAKYCRNFIARAHSSSCNEREIRARNYLPSLSPVNVDKRCEVHISRKYPFCVTLDFRIGVTVKSRAFAQFFPPSLSFTVRGISKKLSVSFNFETISLIRPSSKRKLEQVAQEFFNLLFICSNLFVLLYDSLRKLFI